MDYFVEYSSWGIEVSEIVLVQRRKMWEVLVVQYDFVVKKVSSFIFSIE